MSKQRKTNIEKEYTKWCKEIAKTNDENELIAHFRKHASSHFIKHKNEGEIGRLIWLVAVFGFLNIFREKFKKKYKISTGDMLFENCIHLKEHNSKPIPSFDVDKFLKDVEGDLSGLFHNAYPRWRFKWMGDEMSWYFFAKDRSDADKMVLNLVQVSPRLQPASGMRDTL